MTRLHLLSSPLSVGLGSVDVFSDEGAVPIAACGILVVATVKTEELRDGLLTSGASTDATAALANANDLLIWASEGVKDATASAKVIPGCPDRPLTEPAIWRGAFMGTWPSCLWSGRSVMRRAVFCAVAARMISWASAESVKRGRAVRSPEGGGNVGVRPELILEFASDVSMLLISIWGRLLDIGGVPWF